MTPEDAIPDDLDDNPTLRSLTALIGEENMARLSMEMGALRVYIPANPGEHHPLAVVIGLDAARKIGQVYGNMAFDVPVQIGINARILELKAQKLSTVRIAHQLRINRRTVQRVISAALEKEQLDLFNSVS